MTKEDNVRKRSRRLGLQEALVYLSNAESERELLEMIEEELVCADVLDVAGWLLGERPSIADWDRVVEVIVGS